MPDLHQLTIHEAHGLLAKRQVSSIDLTKAVLKRIAEVEPKVRAYVTVTEDLALEQAAAADKRIAAGNAGPLTGIPMQLKDNLMTRGVKTTCSSRMLEKFVAVYDATTTIRLHDAGAVLLGKGNMDEFAMGSSTENSAFFPTHNPWDLQRVPGGSSGGPAAAVAAGEAFFALGSDTGGSIRQPASFCNVVGLKPTYGLVSRYGLVAFASSLDQIGPFTVDVTDCATVLQAIASHDPLDSTSANRPVPDFKASLQQGIKGLRIGVPKEYFEGIDHDVASVLRRAIDKMAGLGAHIVEGISLRSTPYALAVYYILAPSEASANLARYDGVRYGLREDRDALREMYHATRSSGFGAEVKRRIMLGTYVLSAGYYDAYYVKASRVRTLIRQDFIEAFEEVDLLLTPTTPSPAFRLGEKTDDPLEMYLSDIYTTTMNLAGVPALALPCGFTRGGLPIGCQIIGPDMSEGTIYRAAHALEASLGLGDKRPPLD